MSAKTNRLRVVILGAGVSASCGIPVAKDILRESMIALGGTNERAAREVHKLLSYIYPDFKKEYRNYPNIEDFLNLLEMAETFNSERFIESDLWPQHRIKDVKKMVVSAVTEFIWRYFISPQPPCAHLELFINDHVPPGDVIITFNWDLTVERALAHGKKSVPVRYQYWNNGTRNSVTLLKPHGSINWFRATDLRKAGISETQALDGKLRAVQFPTLLFGRDLIRAAPVIVPPVSNKTFSDYSVFQETWESVYRAISSATVLTILGYSLPREDQFTRFVFRRALRNNFIRRKKRNENERLEVIVVNPDEATESTFARLLGREEINFQFHRTYFEDFVDSLPRL